MSSTVYTPELDSIHPYGWSLTRTLPDEFLGLSPSELEDERGRYQMLAIDAGDEKDAAFFLHKISVIDRKIERYRTHQTIKVRWPNRPRSELLVQLARELKQAVPLDRFINDEVMTTRLERSGDRMKGTCPIPTHPDKTPSFVVYPDGGWKCFGCGCGGDIFTLIALVYGLPNFRDQVGLLSDYYGRGVA